VFIASKIGWLVGNPAALLLFVLVAGAVLLWFPRARRLGRWVVTAAVLVFAVLSVVPLGGLLLATLEDRFPRPDPVPERVDGIIVLGGSFNVSTSFDRRVVSLNEYADRLTTFVALARHYEEARLVFSGGSASLVDQSLKESDIARSLLEALGVPHERVTFERSSRNTCENAASSKESVRPAEGEVWLLVTSGFHMPRAIACFRAVGWEIVPYPTDYQTPGRDHLGLGLNPVAGLSSLSLALHEFIGLAVYRAAGMTRELWPGPEE
jgi:uncharacterized SAM-binding protein YcdF (DUF218 family)